MNRICVVASDGRAYYAIVSKLRDAGLAFLLPSRGNEEGMCDIVVTTGTEVGSFHVPTVAIEELDDDPDVARGQILSKMIRTSETLLIGVDPGTRIGVAAFLGETRLASRTFNSKGSACAIVVRLVRGSSPHKSVVRIGDGNVSMAVWMAENLVARLPGTVVEIVNESGTSKRTRVKGLQRDESSAARIALRKGAQFTRGDPLPRSR